MDAPVSSKQGGEAQDAPPELVPTSPMEDRVAELSGRVVECERHLEAEKQRGTEAAALAKESERKVRACEEMISWSRRPHPSTPP